MMKVLVFALFGAAGVGFALALTFMQLAWTAAAYDVLRRRR